jgi:calcineurin-like phosphoesterase family protein
MVTERGFVDANQMNSAIIDSINDDVRTEDQLYIIGDLSFTNVEETNQLLQRINCKHKFLLLGNHDNKKLINKILHNFAWVKDYYEISYRRHGEVHKQKICMFHYPMLTWNCAHHGSWHLCGHSHGSMEGKYTTTRMDVGWDIYRRPICIEDIERYMSTKTFSPVDHHR